MLNLRLGIDIGSTTAKAMILNGDRDLLFTSYCRHNAETQKTLQAMLADAREKPATCKRRFWLQARRGWESAKDSAFRFFRK